MQALCVHTRLAKARRQPCTVQHVQRNRYTELTAAIEVTTPNACFDGSLQSTLWELVGKSVPASAAAGAKTANASMAGPDIMRIFFVNQWWRNT